MEPRRVWRNLKMKNAPSASSAEGALVTGCGGNVLFWKVPVTAGGGGEALARGSLLGVYRFVGPLKLVKVQCRYKSSEKWYLHAYVAKTARSRGLQCGATQC